MFNISNFILLQDLYTAVDRNDIAENMDDLLSVISRSGLAKHERSVEHRTDLVPINVIIEVS
jgi:hypothetical protein